MKHYQFNQIQIKYKIKKYIYFQKQTIITNKQLIPTNIHSIERKLQLVQCLLIFLLQKLLLQIQIHLFCTNQQSIEPNMLQPLNHNHISIAQQSDIDSQNQQINTSKTISQPNTQDLYFKFASSKFYLLTTTLKRYAEQINQFLQTRKNVLFIFGPSGSGKQTLVKKILSHNQITYQTIQQYEDQNQRIVPLSEAILKSLKKISSRRVYLCYDFPIFLEKWNSNEIKEFKRKFNEDIKSTIIKLIFILNEQIYNSFYVLNEKALDDHNISRRKNVSVLKMKKFAVLQIKNILKEFVIYEKLSHHISLTKDLLDQIVQHSNGDLRKALHMLYWKIVQNKAEKILKESKRAMNNAQLKRPPFAKVPSQKFKSKNQFQQKYFEGQNSNTRPKFPSTSIKNTHYRQEEQKSLSSFSSMSQNLNRVEKNSQRYERFLKNKPETQARFTLYHGLGKLLYGKRLNVKNNPKNKKDISCYYSEKQLNQYDPPFYFDPIGLFHQLRVDLDIVTKLLQQNYLSRFGKIKDIAKMAQVFIIQDGFFSFINKIEDQQVEDIKISLLTWGILIYNRNSRTDNLKMMKIQKSQITNVDKKIAEKYRLIKQYFVEWGEVKDLIMFGHLTRKMNSQLSRTLFNQSISRSYVQRFDEGLNTVVDEEEKEQQEEDMKMRSEMLEKELREDAVKREKRNKDLERMLKELEEEDDNVSDISCSSSQKEKQI